MRQESNDHREVIFHRFVMPCIAHDRHFFFIAGLDHAVDDAAFELLRRYKRLAIEVEWTRETVPLNQAYDAYYGVFEDADLPY